ncbi:MAG: cardiolipin synthase [Eubacteriales bacterium]|nr:cardiolipin synthase [Eubacteriales bacterium]
MRNSEENSGLHLIKKHKKTLLRAVFSRAGLIVLLLLLQIALIALAFSRLRVFLPHFVTVMTIFSAAMAMYLLNSRHDPSAKLTWIVVILVLPIFGALLYAYTRSDIGHRLLKRRFWQIQGETQERIPQDPAVLARAGVEAPELEGLTAFVGRTGCYPAFDGCRVRYFPLGDELFPALLEELEKAEKFIFLEFFIVDEGVFWGRVLEILARKAAAGVDVRLLYDGTNEFFNLPRSYPKKLEALGIQCRSFAPVHPFVSTHYNYRDHRKILVVDGRVAMTGGVNLADEYINVNSRFGHWKDTAVMVYGPAVTSFTLMFLQTWNITERETSYPYLDLPAERQEGSGFVLPYADFPLDDERVGEWVYMDILNRARRYVHIFTPYLILDGEMETALKFAAERGVDVRLILPGIPDKKLAWALAKTHYPSLLESGVKIYEYTPGFVHAKCFVADDREAVVGTINLDYRSLYHHFECALYMNGCEAVADVERDFRHTQEKCRLVTAETLRQEKASMRLAGFFMKVIAPLF